MQIVDRLWFSFIRAACTFVGNRTSDRRFTTLYWGRQSRACAYYRSVTLQSGTCVMSDAISRCSILTGVKLCRSQARKIHARDQPRPCNFRASAMRAVWAGHWWASERLRRRVLHKALFLLPELTARVDGWPVSITRQHGLCWRARVSTSRVDGPSVNTGSGNRA